MIIFRLNKCKSLKSRLVDKTGTKLSDIKSCLTTDSSNKAAYFSVFAVDSTNR